MRQIKFRGLTEGGTCVYGDLINYENGRKAIIGRQLSAPGYLSVEGARISPVKAETVGQFTGLTDKNGVDIYEGDVVKYLTHTAHVFWSPQDFGFVHYNEVIGGYAGLSFFTGYKDFEVIGNIHQNPELLEQKQ